MHLCQARGILNLQARKEFRNKFFCSTLSSLSPSSAPVKEHAPTCPFSSSSSQMTKGPLVTVIVTRLLRKSVAIFLFLSCSSFQDTFRVTRVFLTRYSKLAYASPRGSQSYLKQGPRDQAKWWSFSCINYELECQPFPVLDTKFQNITPSVYPCEIFSL